MSFTLDSERKLNTEIMNVYDSIKNIKHFDYGFVNCDYSFLYSNLGKLNEDFVTQVKAFIKNKRYNSNKYKHVKNILDEQMVSINEDGNNDFFEEFLYDIASVLRDFDGHELNEFTDITGEYEETGEDYPDILLLHHFAFPMLQLRTLSATINQHHLPYSNPLSVTDYVGNHNEVGVLHHCAL